MRWFFRTDDQGVIQMRARMEGSDVVGHAFEEVRPGEQFYGLSYDMLREARVGVVEVSQNGRASILSEEQ